MFKVKNISGVILIIAMFVISCNKWKNDTTINQQDLTQNLLQVISANPDLSKFREYVGKVGLDTLLQASKTFTVWAPNNTALATLDASIIADNAKLKTFVLNHISNQLYFIRDVQVPLNIQMLNGKYNSFSTTKFADAALVSADRYVSNGVLHTINSFVTPLQSIWEFVNSTSSQYLQNAYLLSLNFNGFDPTKATIDSISFLTGQPIYHPGTGIVPRNIFNDRVLDLKREDKQYTYFLMQDANFVVEADSLKNYFSTISTSISTDSLTRWNVLKDLAYETAYPSANLVPATLVSKFGITVPINSAYVVDVKKMSNGYVYIMSRVDVLTKNKFLPITIQAENPSGFLIDKSGNTSYRIKLNPVTLVNYSDILVSGHGVTTFYSYYRINEMNSMKYSVYALGVNDFQSAAFSQTINAWHTGLSALQGTLTHAVPLSTATGAYNELYLGDITISKYGTIDWRLTSITTGPILLDYLRLVPLP